jgi:hypothetical protein
MPTRPLFDPRMAEELGDFFPSLCTVQSDEGVEDAHGMKAPDWQDAAGLIEIPCAVAPTKGREVNRSDQEIPCAVAPTKGREVKRSDQTYVVADFTVLLRGDYPAVGEAMRAVVTGPNAGVYDILLAQEDSHAGLTRLLVNVVR